jgi:hypothetical protein
MSGTATKLQLLNSRGHRMYWREYGVKLMPFSGAMLFMFDRKQRFEKQKHLF